MKAGRSRRPRRLAATAAFLVVAVTLAAACGGEDDDRGAAANGAFVARYDQVTTTFEVRTEEIREQGRLALGTGDSAVLAVYEELLDATLDAQAAYSDIEPAPDVRAAFEKLTEQLDLQAEVLSAVVEAAGSADDTELAVQLQELATVVVEVTNARLALDRQIDDLAVAPDDS